MTLDDPERQNRVFINFFGNLGLQDISRANCAEINWDRHGQAAWHFQH